MLKLLRTKRGFTLVEVMVAFVIFAIMAGMVGVILNSTMMAKQQNTDIEAEIEAQKQAYYLKSQNIDKDEYDALSADSSNYSGTLSFDFKKNTESGSTDIGTTSIDFVAADPTKSSDNMELEYYIGEDGNDGWKEPKTDTNKTGGTSSSVLGGLDCGIYGTNGIDSVRVGIEPVEVDGKTRYYIYFYPTTDSSTLSNNIKYYMQVRIKFPSNITAKGYCNKNNGNDEANGNNSAVELTIPGDKKTIRIAGNGEYKTIFDARSAYPTCWVELSSPLTDAQIADPCLIFGDSGESGVVKSNLNGAKTGSTVNLVEFFRYTVADDPATEEKDDAKTYVNVFAAKADEATPGTGEAEGETS